MSSTRRVTGSSTDFSPNVCHFFPFSSRLVSPRYARSSHFPSPFRPPLSIYLLVVDADAVDYCLGLSYSFFTFLSRITYAISPRYTGRPLGLVDLSFRSWTSRLVVSRPLYVICLYFFSLSSLSCTDFKVATKSPCQLHPATSFRRCKRHRLWGSGIQQLTVSTAKALGYSSITVLDSKTSPLSRTP